MNIKKTTVYTAELSINEIEFIVTGLGALAPCETRDKLLEDFKLIQTNGISEVRHNA